MKRTINYLFAAFTLIAAASCTKDIQPNRIPNDGQSELRTIELSFEDSGITKVGVSDRTPQWEAGDEVWISNGTTSETITLTAGDITSNVAKISTTLSGTLYAVYPASAQNGVIDDSGTKKIGFKIPTSTDGAFGNAHIAVAEGTTSLTFKNVVSILKITTEAATKLVNISSASAIAGEFKVNYSNRVVESGTTQAKGINITSSAAGEKYVAVASGTAFNALEFTAVKAATDWAYKKSSQTTDLSINTMYNIGDVSGWGYTTTNSLLWAQFTAADGKQIRFSKGNLYWTGSAFKLEANQTDFPTSWSDSHVGYFFWTILTDYQSGTASYMPYASSYSYSGQTTSDKFWCGEDNKLTVDGQSDMYTLSSDEWTYLLNTRTSSAVNGVANARYCKATVNGIGGLILFPDSYTHPEGVPAPTKVNEPGTRQAGIEFTVNNYSSDDWSTMESAGCVLLPLAYYRDGVVIRSDNTARYWSSTTTARSTAHYLRFYKSTVNPSDNGVREYGCSVRLVSAAQ